MSAWPGERGLFMNVPSTLLQCGSADFPVRRVRYLRFVELWERRGWVIKVYLLSAHGDELPCEYLAKAKTLIEAQLSEAERTLALHRVGFLILSHGAVSNWIMLDWWSSHILYHRIFRGEGMPPEWFIDAPLNLFQCVYELCITAFESEAWRKHVAENPTPDLQAYINAQLNTDV
jgi:hypothetical protein